MKYLIVLVALFAVVVSDFVTPQNGQIVFLPRNKKAVSQSEAKEYCANMGGSLPSGFNVKTRDLIGTLFEHASDGIFWVDKATKISSGQYRWDSTGGTVDPALWKQGEPTGEGDVVLKKDSTGQSVGLYVHTPVSVPHLVICSIDLSSKQKIQSVHAKWAVLPLEEMEEMEKMLIEAHFNDPFTSVKAHLEDLDKRTGVLLRLIQRLIETQN